MPPKTPYVHHRAQAKAERDAVKAADAAQAKAKADDDKKWGGESLSKAELAYQKKQQEAQDKNDTKQRKQQVNEDDAALMASVKLTNSAKKNLRALGEHTGGNGALTGDGKVTQFQLQQRRDEEEKQRQVEFEKDQRKKEKILDKIDIGENTNHLLKQEMIQDEAKYGSGNVYSARNIDAAIIVGSAISGADLIANDKGAQKRKLKQAYKQFETERLPELREDNPGLKLSQLKEQCWAEFKRLNPDA